jgi:hypothetical protein
MASDVRQMAATASRATERVAACDEDLMSDAQEASDMFEDGVWFWAALHAASDTALVVMARMMRSEYELLRNNMQTAGAETYRARLRGVSLTLAATTALQAHRAQAPGRSTQVTDAELAVITASLVPGGERNLPASLCVARMYVLCTNWGSPLVDEVVRAGMARAMRRSLTAYLECMQ